MRLQRCGQSSGANALPGRATTMKCARAKTRPAPPIAIAVLRNASAPSEQSRAGAPVARGAGSSSVRHRVTLAGALALRARRPQSPGNSAAAEHAAIASRCTPRRAGGARCGERGAGMQPDLGTERKTFCTSVGEPQVSVVHRVERAAQRRRARPAAPLMRAAPRGRRRHTPRRLPALARRDSTWIEIGLDHAQDLVVNDLGVAQLQQLRAFGAQRGEPQAGARPRAARRPGCAARRWPNDGRCWRS